jgi:hypothetical protein
MVVHPSSFDAERHIQHSQYKRIVVQQRSSPIVLTHPNRC